MRAILIQTITANNTLKKPYFTHAHTHTQHHTLQYILPYFSMSVIDYMSWGKAKRVPLHIFHALDDVKNVFFIYREPCVDPF